MLTAVEAAGGLTRCLRQLPPCRTACLRDAIHTVLALPLPSTKQRRPRDSSLFDSGATHSIHATDVGAVPGSWQPDVTGLWVGNKQFLPCYGSVDKDFIDPGGGPDIRRRVLIAPGVLYPIWSHSEEVDKHGSTVVDSPSGAHLELADGRRVTIVKTGLRWVALAVRPTNSICMAVLASIAAPAISADVDSQQLAAGADVGSQRFVAGVGKRPIQLTALQHLRLWHCRLGHPSASVLLATLAALGVRCPRVTVDTVRAFNEEACDLSNAFKQRRKPVQCAPPRVWSEAEKRAVAPSPTRALRPLRRVHLDVFGPVRWPSAQHSYVYLIGYYDEYTGYRWAFGCKTHVASVVEEVTQRLRAALRVAGLGEIEIIRSDNASEFARAQRWHEYLADCDIFPEFSVPYSPWQIGVERGWGVAVPTAGILLQQLSRGMPVAATKRHWYTAAVHAFFLGNARQSTVVTVDGASKRSSAHLRLWQRECHPAKFTAYGARVRYVLDEAMRDSKFDEHARPGFYVGISPSNASAHHVWNGSSHDTVGGSCTIDETDFIRPLAGPASRFEAWPRFDVDDTDDAPQPAAAPRPARAPTPMVDLPIGSFVEVLWPSAGGKSWYRARVVDFDDGADGRMHKVEYVGWEDRNDFVGHHNFGVTKRKWRRCDDDATPAHAPADGDSGTAVIGDGGANSGVALDAGGGSDGAPVIHDGGAPLSGAPVPATHDGGAALPPVRRRSRDAAPVPYNLRRRAGIVAALFAAAAAGGAAPTPAASSVPEATLREAAALDDLSDLPPDAGAEPEPSECAAASPGRADGAAQHAVACVHGVDSFTSLDDESIHDLQRAGEVYVFDIDEMSSHPALLAVKAKQVVASRKTVVYYTPEGVVRAIEPKSVKEALASLQRDQWLNAIHLELQNLRDHGAYHLVPASEALSQGKKILRMTFVFKVKLNDDSSLSKFKARLCVVGSSMEQGSDYWESYAACARTTSVKLVLITTTVAGWVDFHFDLYGAFLSAEIDTDVYTYQPHGVPSEEGPNGEQMVWKLDKAIYGTVQAARLFTQKFRNALLAMGFESSMDDENVYRLDHELGQIILSTHIDDGIGGASTQAVLDWFYERVKAAGFSFSAPPGPWETVLGFGVVRDHAKRTVMLTARKHIDALATEHLASEARDPHVCTPDTPEVHHLEPPPVETAEQAAALEPMRKLARSLKGSLIYIAQVHPGIAHAVSRVCSFMAKPTHRSYACAKHILAWLCRHRALGVTFGGPHLRSLDDLQPRGAAQPPMSSLRDASLACSVDSDLSGRALPKLSLAEAAAAPPDRASSRSQLGYEFSIAGGCFDATSRRQPSTALDTAVAETFACSTAAAHLINITGVLRFVSFGVLGADPVPMWCDNEVAVMVANDASSLKRMAYIARRIRFLQELVKLRLADVKNVPGKVNPADALTKHLHKQTYREYMARLYNTDINTFC